MGFKFRSLDSDPFDEIDYLIRSSKTGGNRREEGRLLATHAGVGVAIATDLSATVIGERRFDEAETKRLRDLLAEHKLGDDRSVEAAEGGDDGKEAL